MAREATAGKNYEDENRADYGMRLCLTGSGYLQIRAGKRAQQLFPDGVKAVGRRVAGSYELQLLNRATNNHFTDVTLGRFKAVQASIRKGQIEGDLPKTFGTVMPEQVTKVRGGLVVSLPAELPVLRPKKAATKGKVKPAPAPQPEPEVAAANAAAEQAQPLPVVALNAPQVAAPAPATTTAVPALTPVSSSIPVVLPTISLRQAVEAVNAYKRAMPDKVDLSVTERGTLRAMAEYE